MADTGKYDLVLSSGISVAFFFPQQGWWFEKREGTLTQFNPSMEDSFDVAAFYVKGQLDFPNQLPENILQLYHQLCDMEQKVKELENEISVYVVQREGKSPLRMMERRNPNRMKSNTVPPKCCIASLWKCAKPDASETWPRRVNTRQVGAKPTKKRHSVSTAVQTTEDGSGRGGRLSKVSWGSKVDVRYINKKAVQSEKSHTAPLHDQKLTKVNEDTKNVVHLKIKIPKDVLNLINDDAQSPKRLENEWNLYNLIESTKHLSFKPDESEEVKSIECNSPEKEQQCESGNNTSCLSPCSQKQTEPKFTNNPVRMRNSLENNDARNTIVSKVVHNTGRESVRSETFGIPVKQAGKSSCESQGCNCKGGTKNDQNLQRLGQSFDMTESELSMLEKAVHNNSAEPNELKIRTEYGSVNVVSHDPDCSCMVCETFGSHNESHPRRSGRSDSAAIISKKVVRVYYNGDYRNIVTHTEECGCEICSSIDEHSYKLKNQRASIISTNTTDLVVKNRGVCGCKNCKTVEMGPPIMDFGAMLSSSSFPQLDKCYYSNATIPSMQSFPVEQTSTDEPPTMFTGPPSITNSDITDQTYETPPPFRMSKPRPKENFIDAEDSCDTTPDRDAHKFKTYKNGDNVYLESRPTRSNRKQNKREFAMTSSANSSPAGPHKNRKGKDTEPQPCSSCVVCKAKNFLGSAPTKSIPSPAKNLNPSAAERAPLISNGETIQPSKDETKDDEKLPSSDEGYTTLEALMQDLIRGQPGVQKDKVYTITLGEVSNKPYTTIHIMDCTSQSNGTQNGSGTKLREPVKTTQGNKETPNVFFIKPLPSLSSNQTSFISEEEASSSKNNQSDGHIAVNNLEDKKMSNDGNGDAPQSDIRKAYKLTVSFGKKFVSFFKQREKKNSTSNVTMAEKDEGSKNIAVYEGAKEPVELLQIEVKPRYFTLDSIRRESKVQLPGPLFYVVGEKNMKVVTTVA